MAASTQNQALAAVLFLYEQVLERPLDRIEGVVRGRKTKQVVTTATRQWRFHFRPIGMGFMQVSLTNS